MPPAASPGAAPVLSWFRADPEARFWTRPGRNTDVSSWLSGTIAVVGTIVVLGLALVASRVPALEWISGLFVARGVVPPFIVFLTLWSAVILLIKQRKLELQKRALSLAVLPQNSDFVLTHQTAAMALERIERLVDSPAHFILLNRLTLALSSLQNLGLVSEMVSMLKSQAEADEQQIATSYQLVQGFIWAIPILGFIGTVLGLSQAIQGFGGTLATSGDFQAVQDSLTVVVSGLATAFDTTLLGLVAAVLLQLVMTVLRRREARFLDDCSDYCQRHVIARLRLK